MPRPLRTHPPGVPLHVVQRGSNRNACFQGDDDRRDYLACLGTYAVECACAIHAYVLMGNHVHLLVTPRSSDGPSRLMQSIGRRYGRHYNDRHGRSGSIWEGRFKSIPIHSERYLIACMRYIELNPVRAGMAPHPAAYPWSSYRANAIGADDRLVTPHPLWYALGRTPVERRESYRMLFDPQLEGDTTPLRQAISPRGRPRKPAFRSAEKGV